MFLPANNPPAKLDRPSRPSAQAEVAVSGRVWPDSSAASWLEACAWPAGAFWPETCLLSLTGVATGPSEPLPGLTGASWPGFWSLESSEVVSSASSEPSLPSSSVSSSVESSESESPVSESSWPGFSSPVSPESSSESSSNFSLPVKVLVSSS